jgi:hypothetical protein
MSNGAAATRFGYAMVVLTARKNGAEYLSQIEFFGDCVGVTFTKVVRNVPEVEEIVHCFIGGHNQVVVCPDGHDTEEPVDESPAVGF